MYDFNFAGCENSEDLLQNGPTCQPETMLGDFRSGGNALSVSQYSQCQSGDFRMGHSQYQTWDGSSQTPNPFAFTFPPLNINWDDPNLYSRLPPPQYSIEHPAKQARSRRAVADRVAQDRQPADGPAQRHDISQPAVAWPTPSANLWRVSHKTTLSMKQRKESEEALHSSIRRLLAEQAQRMDEIALEHGVSVEKVKKLMGGTRHYTASRSAQLENTLIHAKAEEVNKGPHLTSTSDLPWGAKHQEINPGLI
ncbi:hypothetical protein P692DRAFT_201800477 [Suillus brevipes Sb2]|nr:hypothetical protein P692DRAFT_201800477 [Suillus brevipes Sb2]